MGILVDVNNPTNMLQRREVEAAAAKSGMSINDGRCSHRRRDRRSDPDICARAREHRGRFGVCYARQCAPADSDLCVGVAVAHGL